LIDWYILKRDGCDIPIPGLHPPHCCACFNAGPRFAEASVVISVCRCLTFDRGLFFSGISCYSIFSFICMFCRSLFVFSGISCYSIFSFICMFCRSLFVFSGISCYSIFSFICMFCRSLFAFSEVCVAQCLVFCSVDHCLFSVWFVLLNV
jgi:hypothetical protein